MKRIISLMSLSLVSLFLVGCSAENNGGIIDFSDIIKPKTEIRVWIDDEKGDYVAELIEEFNKVEPDILVSHQHMGTADAREKLKTFGPSGNGADVWQLPHDNLAVAISEDLVLGLSDSVKTRLEDTLHPLGMQIGTVNYNESTGAFDGSGVDKLYGVPQSIESIVLMYNKALISGDAPVTTFEQLIAEATTYMETNNSYYLGQSSHWADNYMLQFAYSAHGFYPFGVNLNDASNVGFATGSGDNYTATANATAAVDWLVNTLKPVVTGTANHDSQNSGAAFEEGKLPYIISGPWMIESYSSKLGENFGVTTIPTINVDGEDKEAQPFTGAIMNAVYKYSNQQEAATKFVEFMSSEVGMQLLYDHKGKLPALKTELLPEDVKNDPILQVVSNQIDKAIPMPVIPSSASYWGPGETMVKSVWNTGNATTSTTAIQAALVTAEKGYIAAEKLRLG
ncbi:MAG: extracellular solute-binding protein [bacterium]